MSFGTMYIAATGLQALGTGMQTISNNLANVDTVGFKAMRTNYESLISDCYSTGNFPNQVGKGSQVGTIQTIFTQGAFKPSQQDTDLAIAGDGFFNVRHSFTGEIMYTRAGVYTFSRDGEGYMEDPNGNVLQGWKMSVPRPGETAVRVGNPVDIQITTLNAPPVATTEVKVVSNLNAGDSPVYIYPAYAEADALAMVEAQQRAEFEQTSATQAIWFPVNAADGTGRDIPIVASAPTITASNNPAFNVAFLENYNDKFKDSYTGTTNTVDTMTIVFDTVPAPNRTKGEMTQTEFNDLVAKTKSEFETAAKSAGKVAYEQTYITAYKEAYDRITEKQTGGTWDMEGNGYAGAWNGQEKPPMTGAEDYTYSESMTVYDSKGEAHTLMTYYQKNPHMDNVWDYIITTDPIEDARLSGDGDPLFSSDATFAGLIQKGKMTFSAKEDDPLKHGGLIKSMEAQNIDLANSLAAVVEAPTPGAGASPIMQTATIGGYYTGKPDIDPATGRQVSSEQTYTLTWGYQDPITGKWQSTNNASPPQEGLTWRDSDNNVGFIPVTDNYPGPHDFGEGLSVTFDSGGYPLQFGAPGTDSMEVVAHSEQTAWTAATPNGDGYFDLDLSFVDKSSGLQPPYPTTAPVLDQTVAINQGAKSTDGTTWTPGEVSTTQYAIKSNNKLNEQDGYPESSQERVYVRDDGMLIGVYDKKREIELYQISLSRFRSPEGLDKKGNNLFGQTDESGDPFTTTPGDGGAGKILGNHLEQSTVDTAAEIVNMILTQRGFQANSKAISTTDTVIATAIQTKR